jgi:hypothetical protein
MLIHGRGKVPKHAMNFTATEILCNYQTRKEVRYKTFKDAVFTTVSVVFCKYEYTLSS